jgi:hypothetical protein
MFDSIWDFLLENHEILNRLKHLLVIKNSGNSIDPERTVEFQEKNYENSNIKVLNFSA